MKYLYVQVRLIAAEADDDNSMNTAVVLDEDHYAARNYSATVAMFENLSAKIDALAARDQALANSK